MMVFGEMRVVMVMLIFLGLRTTVSTRSKNCSYEPLSQTLECFMRMLEGDEEERNNTVISAGRAKALRVECSQEFLESDLRPNHFGNLPKLENLTIEGCKIKEIPQFAFSGLKGLGHLVINTRNSEWSAMAMDVAKQAFSNLKNLQTLEMPDNNLWSLPSSMFCSLPSLTSLNMSKNYLQQVTDFGISPSSPNSPCLRSLRKLDLSKNKISHLPNKAFSHLFNLEVINLSNNLINSLDDNALSGLSSIQSIKLSNNRLVALPPELFSDATQLREIYLQNNSLSALAPGLFDDLDHLLVLNLSRNDLTNDWIKGETFSGLVRLVALDLSHNQLTILDSTVLRDLSSLQILDLQNNHIQSINPHTFLSQNNLHILLLSNNQIEQIQPHSFDGLSVLSSLSLDHNHLQSLHPELLKNCSSLQDLTLNNNLFNQVPAAISHLTLLKTLDIGENKISKLNDNSFRGLENLYGLRLSGNGISSIQRTVFDQITTVEVLNLAHNNIKNLNHTVFLPLKRLSALRLDDNELTDINGLLTAQTELRWLNVSANMLQWFDYAFIPKNLEWLDLHSNQIEELGNYYQLKDGFSLKTLDASFNKIRKIDSSSLLTSLEYLYINNNDIDKISANTFVELQNVTRVEIHSNNLVKMQLAALAISPVNNIDKLPEFLIGHNPFICDCEMDYLQKINQMSQSGHYPRVMDLEDITCTLSRTVKNSSGSYSLSSSAPLLDVAPSEFLCQYTAHCFALCMCCDFFACDCRMQCPDGCSCHHDSTWKHNMIQCTGRGHKDVPPLIPMDATSVYLDGNHFGDLESQAFIGRKKVSSLFLNSSKITLVGNKTFNGLSELEILHLESNSLRQLKGAEFENMTSLRELYLHNNKLYVINDYTFSSLISLEVLFLHNNLLMIYPVWELAVLPEISVLSLANNPWSCECDFVRQFQQFVNGLVVVDSSKLECVDINFIGVEGTRVNIGANITCSNSLAVSSQSSTQSIHLDYIPMTIALLGVCVILIIATLILFVFRTPLKVWVHSRYGIRVLGPCASNKDSLYDAFVSYSIKDDEFMRQIFVPNLESDEFYYRLCLQHRDLPNSRSIISTWPGVSSLCAKLVLVVSRAFLETEWEQVKFVLQDIRDTKSRANTKSANICQKPVIVLLEEISTLDLAAVPEFNLLMKTSTVIKWTEPGFWNKLRFYLPDGSKGPLNTPPTMQTYQRNISNRMSGNTLHGTSSPKAGTAHPVRSCVQPADWQYDSVGHNSTDSSTSTRSTTAGSGSPRSNAGEPGSNKTDYNVSQMGSPHVNGLVNPMDQFSNNDQWSDMSDCGYGPNQRDHTYQSIAEHAGASVPADHIYHTLEPGLGRYNAVGNLQVMLPGGQLVPATLVRNATGKMIPMVQVSPAHALASPDRNNTRVSRNKEIEENGEDTGNGPLTVTFPKTIVYKQQRSPDGYLV